MINNNISEDKALHLYKKYKMKYINLQNGGNICSNLSKNKTIIHYISNYLDLSNGTTFKIDSKTVKLYTFDQILLLNDLNSIINCTDNIYIYIENIDRTITQKITGIEYPNLIDHKNKELADHINLLLVNTEKSPNIYKNVTIVNFINTTEYVIYTLRKDNISLFRKIVNIFPSKIFTNISNFKIDSNRNKMMEKNSISEDDTFKPYTYYGGNITKYITSKLIKFKDYTTIKKRNIKDIISTISLNPGKKLLSNFFWWNYYFMIPYCAYGRLLQSTGTCWCNALINLLFLTDKIKIKLINTYESDAEKDNISKITFKDFTGTKNYPLKHLLLALVNIILIKHDNASETDNNIIAILAAKIKGLSTGRYDDNYNFNQNGNISYGDGLYSLAGSYVINEILKLSFSFFSYTIKDDEKNERIKSDIKLLDDEHNKFNKETCLEINKLLKEKHEKLALLSEEKSNYEKKISEEKSDYKKKISEEKSNHEKKISEEKSDYEKKILYEESDYKKKISKVESDYKKKISKYDDYKQNHDEINKNHKINHDSINQEYKQNQDEINENHKINHDGINEKHKKNIADINEKYVKNIDDIKNFNEEKLYEMKQKYINQYEIYIKNIQSKKLEILEKIKITSLSTSVNDSGEIIINKNVTIEFSLTPKDSIIFIENDKLIHTAEPTIQINGNTYKLLGSILSNDNHAICGLICDNKYYVYDSNNIIAYTDWHKGNLSGYYEKLPVSFLSDKIYYIKILVYGLN